MGKSKLNRKTVCSPESMHRIKMIIAENWDETWEVVRQRDKNSHAMKYRNLKTFL
jgi:hypothetical protein